MADIVVKPRSKDHDVHIKNEFGVRKDYLFDAWTFFEISTWDKLWYYIKDREYVNIDELAKVLDINNQSLRNKISRHSNVSVAELGAVMAYVNWAYGIHKGKTIRLRIEKLKEE